MQASAYPPSRPHRGAYYVPFDRPVSPFLRRPPRIPSRYLTVVLVQYVSCDRSVSPLFTRTILLYRTILLTVCAARSLTCKTDSPASDVTRIAALLMYQFSASITRHNAAISALRNRCISSCIPYVSEWPVSPPRNSKKSMAS